MAEVTLDRKLNLCLELTLEDGGVAYIHSVPIARQIWRTHYSFLSIAINNLYADGLSPSLCARIAYLRMLEMVEKDKDRWGVVPSTLFAEIWRLTNVKVPTERGYETLPFYDVMKGDRYFSPEDVEEVQNFLCFFTAASWVHGGNRKGREAFQSLLREGFGVQTTASSAMEWLNSVPISKPEEPTGESPEETVSSIPA